ncbi:MAG TPA: hypothetical protein VNJ51_15165 [Candidatus Dormibacteraeota bacterium]|nr:hypothetical protein [Candidatus Dormibacteraeota bacterium]
MLLKSLATVTLLAVLNGSVLAAAPPRNYRAAPRTYRVTTGRPSPSHVPRGYRVLPGGRGYYPPAVRVVGPPPRLAARGPRPSWYRPYWVYPSVWWHPPGWYGPTRIWYRDGWWFEVAIIGALIWEWSFHSDDAYAHQAPPAITCTYDDPASGHEVYLTVIGYECPSPVNVYVREGYQGP